MRNRHSGYNAVIKVSNKIDSNVCGCEDGWVTLAICAVLTNKHINEKMPAVCICMYHHAAKHGWNSNIRAETLRESCFPFPSFKKKNLLVYTILSTKRLGIYWNTQGKSLTGEQIKRDWSSACAQWNSKKEYWLLRVMFELHSGECVLVYEWYDWIRSCLDLSGCSRLVSSCPWHS